MTENEAKQVLENVWDFVTLEDDNLGDFVEKAIDVANNIFEEIQQYRAIGTIEEFKALKEKSKAEKIVFNSESDREYEDYMCPTCKTILQQRPKGATRIHIYKYKHCIFCGQKLDWQ